MKPKIHIVLFMFVFLALTSCNDFVDVGTPKTQIVRSKMFETDAGAKATISGMLAQMMGREMFASGGGGSVTVMGGLSADELLNHSTSLVQVSFFDNSLTPVNNPIVDSNWAAMYSIIYQCNATLEGCESSKTLSKEVRDQVIGEAKFIRAFTYFYLVNLFGDVPLITTTDYRVNRSAYRAQMTEVYKQIETDLLDAQKRLLDDYSMSDGEKVEPNKWAAAALLARVYLYQKKWAEAESQASSIIESGQFSLPEDLNSVFLMNSDEAIWQLMPVIPSSNTNEAQFMVIMASPTRVSLSPTVLEAFEPDDARLSAWVGTFEMDDESFHYVYKHKVNLPGEPLTEYYTVFRLAEQYLIRAEARAMQNKLPAAESDLNAIRARAQLAPFDGNLTQPGVIEAVMKERRTELFVEWGHRWFDLKRTAAADAVLGPIKRDWQSKDALFPIPQSEIIANPNLTQNP